MPGSFLIWSNLREIINTLVLSTDYAIAQWCFWFALFCELIFECVVGRIVFKDMLASVGWHVNTYALVKRALNISRWSSWLADGEQNRWPVYLVALFKLCPHLHTTTKTVDKVDSKPVKFQLAHVDVLWKRYSTVYSAVPSRQTDTFLDTRQRLYC